MSTKNPVRSARLGLEQLESREVLSPSFTGRGGGLSVAFGNVMPTVGVNEYVTGSGPGQRATVRVWDPNGNLLFTMHPFGQYRGGVYVALGNLVREDPNVNPTKPDPLEIVCSTAGGTTGRVKIFTFQFGTLQRLANIAPFGPNYTGGIQIACGDVAGDRSSAPFTNQSELIVGQEINGSTIKVYTNDATAPTPHFFQIRRFNAFEVGYTGGVSVAAANIDPTQNDPNDPYDYDFSEIIVGKARELPQVKIFDAQNNNVVTLADYMAYDTTLPFNRVGINVYAGDTDATRGAEIYINPKRSANVRILDGWTGGTLGDFTVAIPPHVVGVNLAIETVDDEPNYILPRQLVSVFASGLITQVPTVWPGAINSPAGLNGSHPAP